VCPSTVNEFRKRGNNGKEGVNELSMQALTELVDKLNAAELEVEKAATMGSLPPFPLWLNLLIPP